MCSTFEVDDTDVMTGEPAEQSPSIFDRADRWMWWPVVVTIVGAICLVLICGLPGTVSFILIPLVVLGWPIMAILLLIPAGLFAKRGKWLRSFSIAVAVFLPILLWKPIFWIADCAHVAISVELGGGQLGSNTPADRKSFQTFDWSVGLAGSNTFMIYDATDEIALPITRHRLPISTEFGFGESCAGNVDHIFGHYYKCSF